MKTFYIANTELMFNKHLMQYQLFIKNPPTKSALQKTVLPYKIKMKSVPKIMKQPPRVGPPKTAVHTTFNKKSKIPEKHPRRSPPPPKRQTYSLQFYWI